MARFQTMLADGLLKELSGLKNIHDVAVKMVDEAIPIVADETLFEVASHHRTGDLEASVEPDETRAGIKSGIVYNKAAFKGYDRHGTSNQLKAAVIEYGTSKQRPQPFLQSVVDNSEQTVADKLQDVFNREVKK